MAENDERNLSLVVEPEYQATPWLYCGCPCPLHSSVGDGFREARAVPVGRGESSAQDRKADPHTVEAEGQALGWVCWWETSRPPGWKGRYFLQAPGGD